MRRAQERISHALRTSSSHQPTLPAVKDPALHPTEGQGVGALKGTVLNVRSIVFKDAFCSGVSPFLAASEPVFSFSLSERMPATVVSMSFVSCTSSGLSVACTAYTIP